MNILQILKKTKQKSNIKTAIETYANGQILQSVSRYFINHDDNPINKNQIYHDSNEFFFYVMEHVLKNVLSHDSFCDLFELISQDVHVCFKCNTETQQSFFFNVDHHLNLNITNSIQESIDEYFKGDWLPEKKCHNCSETNCITRNIICLGSFPKYFIVTVKRWILNEETLKAKKDDRFIYINKSIQIKEHHYRIISLVVHKTSDPNGLESGHFFCNSLVINKSNNGKENRDQWFNLDDNYVKSISIKEALETSIVKSGVYLLIYKKILKKKRKIYHSIWASSLAPECRACNKKTTSKGKVKKKSLKTPVGLKNVSSNCYMNAALQALSSINILVSNLNNDCIIMRNNGFYGLIDSDDHTTDSLLIKAGKSKLVEKKINQCVSDDSSSSKIIECSNKRKMYDTSSIKEQNIQENKVKKSRTCHEDSNNVDSITSCKDSIHGITLSEKKRKVQSKDIIQCNNFMQDNLLFTSIQNIELNMKSMKSSCRLFYEKFGCFKVNTTDNSVPAHDKNNSLVSQSRLSNNFDIFLHENNVNSNFSNIRSILISHINENKSITMECYRRYTSTWPLTNSFFRALWTASYFKRDMPLCLDGSNKDINLFHFMSNKENKESDVMDHIEYGKLITIKEYQSALANFMNLLHFQYVCPHKITGNDSQSFLFGLLEKIFNLSISSSFDNQISTITRDNPWLPHFYMTTTQYIISHHVSESNHTKKKKTPMKDSYFDKMSTMCDTFCEEMFKSDNLTICIPCFVDHYDQCRKKKLGITVEIEDDISYHLSFFKWSHPRRGISCESSFNFKPVPGSLLSIYSIEFAKEKRINNIEKLEQYQAIGIKFFHYLKIFNDCYNKLFDEEKYNISQIDALSITEYYKFDKRKITTFLSNDWKNDVFSSLTMSSYGKCAICQEEFANTLNQSIHKTLCNHYFHNRCIIRLIEKSKNIGKNKFSCPLCSTHCNHNIQKPTEQFDLSNFLCTRNFLQLVDDIRCHRSKNHKKNYKRFDIKSLGSFKAFNFYCRRNNNMLKLIPKLIIHETNFLVNFIRQIRLHNYKWVCDNFSVKIQTYSKCLFCETDDDCQKYNVESHYFIRVSSEQGCNRISNFLDEHNAYTSLRCNRCSSKSEHDIVTTHKYFSKMVSFPKIIIFYIPRKTLDEGYDKESVNIPRILTVEKNRSYRVMSVILKYEDDVHNSEDKIRYRCNCLMLCTAKNVKNKRRNSWVSIDDLEVRAITENEALDSEEVKKHCFMVIYKNMDDLSQSTFITSDLYHTKIINLPMAINYEFINRRFSSFFHALAQSLAFHDFKSLFDLFRCFHFTSIE